MVYFVYEFHLLWGIAEAIITCIASHDTKTSKRNNPFHVLGSRLVCVYQYIQFNSWDAIVIVVGRVGGGGGGMRVISHAIKPKRKTLMKWRKFS